MALINQNSVIGVTSITSPGASNVLTVHTSDTTERLRITSNGLSFSGTNASLDTSGNLTVGGNVSVGGTLTYEDVTNIDSVGIITAQAGIRVTGGSVGIGTDNPVGNLEIRDSKANLIVAKDGLTVKSNSDLATQYDLIQLGAGGALASYSTATATADTQFIHNAYRHSGGQWKYRYADTAMRFRMNSPGNTFIFESAASGSADADITFAERLRIDSSGRLLVGTDSTVFDNNFGIGMLQVTNKTGYQHVLISGHSAAAANATCLSVGRSRGTQASPAYLQSGDHIARFSATSYNGGNYQTSGAIDFFAADNHASNDLPGYISFKTVPDGSATPTERLRITSSGVVGINTTTGFDTSVGLAVRNGASGSDHTMIDIIANTNETSRLVFSDDTDHNQGRIQYNHLGNSLSFYTNGNNERLRIGSAGQIGLSGDNYGTAGQVIKSTGTGTAPTWQNLHQFMFFGEQDTSHTIATGTYTRLINLGTNDFSIGDSSIASFDESVGRVTIGADGAGYYYLEMHGGIDDVQASDYVQVVIKKNGSSSGTDGTRLSTYGRGWNSGAANQVVTTSTSCIALLAAGDYVQFYIYHNEGSSEPTEQNRCAVMGYKL